uniref:Uncharacterized protein n=1 Tax=Amphimedon queenslandica TaxID=400682 RepID=A0A1X7VMD2_AMPQE
MTCSTSTDVSFGFLCGLRRYHVYQTVSASRLHELLATKHEQNNLHDRHAIAATKRLPGRLSSASIVGHLPKKISKVTRYIMEHGAVVTLKVMDIHYRRSPLVQGGLEIPVMAQVQMTSNVKNRTALDEYNVLVKRLYKEPIDGIFEDATAELLKQLDVTDEDSEEIDKEGEIEEIDKEGEIVEEIDKEGEIEEIDKEGAIEIQEVEELN